MTNGASIIGLIQSNLYLTTKPTNNKQNKGLISSSESWHKNVQISEECVMDVFDSKKGIPNSEEDKPFDSSHCNQNY